uniref:Si:ch73-71c20.5 n=1 Tax=Takifugu rubripes TaxID=31033 RepID=A0A674MIR1_TAKRU
MRELTYSTNMAAATLTAARTALRSLAACQRLRLHVSPAASCSSSRTEPQKSGEASSTSRLGEDLEGPEYIPKRKAKNPMMKIGYAWMIGLPTGIIGFLLAKRQVDKNRLKQLKIRQRMKKSNEGEYEGSRYHHPTQDGFAPGLEVKSSVWTV